MKAHATGFELLATALFAIPACGVGSASLGELRDVHLAFSISDDDVHPIGFQADEFHIGGSLNYDESHGCKTLTRSTTVRVNGTALNLLPGGEASTFNHQTECDLPFFVGTVKRRDVTGQDGRLVITDGETTLTVVVTAMFEDHRWAPNDDLSTVHVGQDVTFAWSVASDIPSELASFGGAYFDNGGNPPPRPNVTFVDRTMHAVFDSTAPLGDSRLNVWGTAAGHTTVCDGVVMCSASVYSVREYAIHVD